LDRQLPPINGFVLTEVKDNPLAQVLIRSPQPDQPENATVLAVWSYGLGRTAVLTTDAGERWAAPWTGWPGYEKFFSQLVRWLMRPTGDTGKFTISTQSRDGEVQVVVNALDQNDDFLNFLPMNASVLDPDMKPVPLQMRQTAPGRYVGTFPADSSGNFFVNVVPEAGAVPLTTGVSVPYSDEYRLRETNELLLRSLVATPPKGGSAGEVFAPLGESAIGDLVASANPFRGGLADARSIRDIWPWAVLVGCCVFFFDVFVRRVAIGMGWVSTAWDTIRGGRAEPASASVRIDSLMVTKERIGDELRRQRAATRYEPTSAASSKIPGPNAKSGTAIESGPPSPSDTSQTPAGDGKSYTERLLEAKRRAKKN
jgi:hypothetical protein